MHSTCTGASLTKTLLDGCRSTSDIKGAPSTCSCSCLPGSIEGSLPHEDLHISQHKALSCIRNVRMMVYHSDVATTTDLCHYEPAAMLCSFSHLQRGEDSEPEREVKEE